MKMLKLRFSKSSNLSRSNRGFQTFKTKVSICYFPLYGVSDIILKDSKNNYFIIERYREVVIKITLLRIYL